MAAYREPVSDPPDYELQLAWTDRATRRARGRLVGPDVEHSGTGLYAYVETRRRDEWVPRFQLRQVGAVFEEPAWVEIGPDGRVFELVPLLSGQADIILELPALEPGEHRIRKDFTIAGTQVRLHSSLAEMLRDTAPR